MRVKSIVTKDPGGNDIINYQYNYDRMDNILTKDTEHGDYIYDYDDLYRLTSSNRNLDTGASLDENFTYDKVGNRITSADTTGNWTYNQNNELGEYDNTSFVYDDNGNMISKTDQTGTTTYIYDIENRLVQVSNLPSPISYYYDPFGRRLWKEVAGARTYFLYADEGLVGEYDNNGTEIKTYGYLPNSTWTTDPIFMKEGINYYFYHNDHLGTPQMMTAINGSVVWGARYGTFGKAEVLTSAITNNLRFPGQYYDSETGLHYNYHRYYDPSTGRYLTPDPIGQDGGINLYLYVEGNTINAIDPFGLYDLWDLGEDTLNFAAGLGNAVTFGGSTWIAEQFMSSSDASILRRTKQCSGSFKAGEWASLGLGVGRLAYAGIAKGGSLVYAARGATMKTAEAASTFRNVLKRVFRLNPWSKFRIYPFAKMVEEKKTSEAIIAAAGRTSPYYNKIGGYLAAGGATALTTTDDCECAK